MTKRFLQITLLSSIVFSGTAAVGANAVLSGVGQDMTAPSIDDFILAQAQGSISADQSQPSGGDLGDELPEELLSQFLADPEAFIANPDNIDIVARVVRQAIAQNPSNLDAIIAAVDRQADARITDAVADGIARAAADYAAAGDTVISSQILAKVSISTSTPLRQAVQIKATEIASVAESLRNEEEVVSEEDMQLDRQEGEILQETDTTLSDSETLSEPGADAPSLATTTTTTSEGGDSAAPNSGTSQPSPISPTNPPPPVTPPPPGDPASPA